MTRSARQRCGIIGRFLVLLFVAPVLPAPASDMARVAAQRVSEDSYRYFLDDMLYTRAGDNRGFGPEHDPAQDNIAALFTSFGLTVTLEPVDYYGATYYNVVGTKLGTTYPEQEYIIGAHYDSVDNPGADDNASGVALVLEAARVLSGYDAEYTMRFIAFDREEQGLFGSEEYVQAHIDDDILGMISADMVAFNTGANSVDIECISTYDLLKDALVEAVAAYGDGLASATSDWTCCSDHVPFSSAGFQACLIIEDWGNRFYHSPRDNVDEPDYIDYAYATRVTRTIVGYLVDHAGVIVDDIPDGDYDGDGDVDLNDFGEFEACFTGSDRPPDEPPCEFFDLDEDGDVDCADWGLFTSVWTGPPDDPPLFWLCSLPAPTAMGDGSRCLAVTAPEHEMPMALLITGDPADEAVSCLSLYIQPGGWLHTTPVFQTFDEWGTVLVCDEAIIPDTKYEVWCDFGQSDWQILSPAVGATTTVWGDTVTLFTGTEWIGPDGAVDIIDVVGILEAFRGLSNAPPVNWVDLIGIDQHGMVCAPDQVIDILDALVALEAFAGSTYWYSTGCPGPCGE